MGKLRVPEHDPLQAGRAGPGRVRGDQAPPEDGARLLADLGGFAPEVLDLVLDHHERLDGGGYPRGLEATRSGSPRAC